MVLSGDAAQARSRTDTALPLCATDPLTRVREALDAQERDGLHRWLRPRSAVEPVIDLASNDYLGLTRDPRITEAAAAAARQWGGGSTGSRLVTGSTALHAELETVLAFFVGGANATVFSSGYLANIGALTAVGGADVTIVSDANNHASIIDACRLARSPIIVYPHRDVQAVDAALASRRTPHAVVVTDAVFSADGDLAPLAELHALARQYGALLVVDEAHSLGVVGTSGRGAVHAAGLAGEPDVIQTVTLSKSLGAQGGAVIAAPEVIELTINKARSFIFDTGLAPAAAGAALAALGVIKAEPHLAAAARTVAERLAQLVRSTGAETTQPAAAVVPAFLGDPRVAVAAAQLCLDAGVHVGCFRPPSVPRGRSCLRLTARANLTDSEFNHVATVLSEAILRAKGLSPA